MIKQDLLMDTLSTRVQRIKISPTLAITKRALELKAAGKDIISLSVGEPDFDTPQFIKDAAIRAIQDGFTKYTAVDGIPGLKQAIVKKFSRENSLQYEAKQILVSCGAKQSFYNLLQAVINPGDEVIIPAPYWVSYPDIAMLADGVPIVLDTTIEQKFKIIPEQLQAAITPKTKLLILNSPSNPSGMVYSQAELKKLADVLLKNPHVLIASDDMYEHIIWTKEPFSNIINACSELYDRTIVINGVSKAYAMTGWRIGYAAGSVEIINAMIKVQSQSTSNPTSISQVAAQEALSGDQTFVKEMNQIFKERHDYIYEELKKIPGLKIQPSEGSFYSFFDVSAIMQKLNIKTDLEFSELLLNQAQIAVVPGSAFGTPNCIRISFATSMQNLKTAVERIKKLF
jgi:aspartate aminotransferase